MATQVVTVRYFKPGTQPPVYLAGSFTEPQWQPQEMEHTLTDNNEYNFHKEVKAEAGKEYQYKLRVGEGDWWILNEDAPTTTDDIGNRNNLLRIPSFKALQRNQDSKMNATDIAASKESAMDPISEKSNVRSHEHAKRTDDNETQDTKLTKLPSEGLGKATEKAASDSLDGNSAPSSKVEDDTASKNPNERAVTESTDGLERSIVADAAATTASIEDYEDKLKAHSGKPPHGEDEVKADRLIENGIGENFATPEIHSGQDEAISQGEPSPTETDDGYVKVRRMSEVAAEVADVARGLDLERPTTPVPDEEAGRLGYRRMSRTPINEVSRTAAEVADSAALLDKEQPVKIKMPEQYEESGYDSPESGDETPFEERAPLFAHECVEAPGSDNAYNFPQVQQAPPPAAPVPYEEEEIDFNDPSLEEFPSDRNMILETVRSLETRLNEDPTSVEGIPPSPVVGSVEYNNYPHPERLELPSPPSNLAGLDRSPSLNSIAEEADGEEDPIASRPSALNLAQITSNPRSTNGVTSGEETHLLGSQPEPVVGPSVDVKEVNSKNSPAETIKQSTSVESPANPSLVPSFIVSDHQLEESNANDKAEEIPTSEVTPDFVVTPATPGGPTIQSPKGPFEPLPITLDPMGTASSSAVDESDKSQVKARKSLPTGASTALDRPDTQSSVRSAATGDDGKGQNFLRAFWRVVFVDWIGGLIMRLCGRRRTLVTVSAMAVLIVGPAMYYANWL